MGTYFTTGQGNPPFLAGTVLEESVTSDPLAGTVNDLAVPGQSQVNVIKLSASAIATINGLVGGSDGRKITLLNVSAFTITLAANAGGSQAQNRFSSTVTIAAGTGCGLDWDVTTQKWIPTGIGGGGAVISPGGSDTCVQFNDNNNFGGDTSFTWNKTTKTLTIQGSTNYQGAAVISPPALSTGTTNDYAPAGLTAARIVRITPDAAGSALSGISATIGQVLTLCNVGSGDLTLLNQNTGSSAANRFVLVGDMVIPSNNSQTIWYDSTSSRWRTLS